jgi:inner membrane protein involved in colicin E2 resistance
VTVLRTVAIIFIFFCSVVAWVILGGTLVHRTDKAKEFGADAVGQLWGTEQRQRAPGFYYKVAREVEVEAGEGAEPGRREKKLVEETVFVDPASTAVDAALKLKHRKKGLLWFSTYVVDFRATYRLRNDSPEPRTMFVEFSFPATSALYDDFTFRAKDEEVELPPNAADSITTSFELAGGESADVVIGYKSPGLDRWIYSFGDGVARVRDFALNVRTDFDDVDFPEGCVSPTAKEKTDDGWLLTWRYQDLVTGYQLGVEMPKKLNPGPIASRISFFAPVSLLFFFTVLFIVSAIKVDRLPPLHPMNYFFLAAAFFAFHLLFAYLADHVDIHLTFLASSLVSCALVFIYVALARGAKYAVAYATFPQLMFLVLFSYAFFYPGYTGLIITVGAIVTLAVLMFATARVDWPTKFAPKRS